MDDSSIRDEIERLVDEERSLQQATEGQPDDERHARLAEVQAELDRCWDLLRQREAHEEFGLNPDQTSLRDVETVEGYEQ
jgi:Protein of unknown function (DUF2630)